MVSSVVGATRRVWICVLAVALVLGCDKANLVPLDAGPGPGAQRPTPPDRTTDGPSGPERVFVLKDVVLRQGMTVWRGLGYNLDDLCSYPPSEADAGADLDASVADAGPYGGWEIECLPTNMAEAPSADGDLCRDNNFGQYLSLGFEPLGLDVEAEARANMEDGEFAFMVRLRDYDGDGDDPLVTAEVVSSVYGVPSGGVRGDPLAWDGSDTFVPALGSIGPDGNAFILDRTAYVTGGVLVVRVPPRADFRFSGTDRSLAIQLTDATLTGRIVGDRLEDATIAGRWPVADFIAQMDGLGLCEGDTLRAIVETAVRGAADVLANPEATPGALVECDAVSFAVGFTGYPGRWGDTPEAEAGVPDPCP